jgi:hypothetical protein
MLNGPDGGRIFKVKIPKKLPRRNVKTRWAYMGKLKYGVFI